ncbi:OLC1v1031008C1 [Oldenlandia corymbosa var. corymbosa]|uniref:OLC1v1031008C1 n=1 Tax=Oldenlandia corymbosa var. corymbosa TaxID=529605 RepID=A0AAV1CJC3_OLDCO|nr:OLC1v1031008C1 [Oldenlandia corymbosa var. corymbosa]
MGKEKRYFTWTTEMDKVLGACLKEELNKGNRLDGKCAWKPTSWTAAMNTLLRQLNVRIEKKHLTSRLKTWHKHYEILHPLLVSCAFNSAIIWDHSNGRIKVNDENVWNEQLEANPKLAPYRKKIVIENWDDICILFSKAFVTGQCGNLTRETNKEKELGSSKEEESFGTNERTVEKDDLGSTPLDGQKRWLNASSSSGSQDSKRRLTTSQTMADVLGRMADSLNRFVMAKTKKATTQEVLRELQKVDLTRTQMLTVLDMMMHDQILFDTFVGLPSDLRQPWILMQLTK